MKIGRLCLWRWPAPDRPLWRVWHGKTVGCYAWIVRIGAWHYEISWVDADQAVA